MKDAHTSLGPRVTASRMVRDYVEEYYEPAAAAADAVGADGAARGRALAAWRARVSAAWAGVKVAGVEADNGPARLGEERAITVTVDLGSLEPADVAVQVLHGPVGGGDEIQQPERLDLAPAGTDEAGRARWTGSIRCSRRALRLHGPGGPRPRRLGHARRAGPRDVGLTAGPTKPA